MSASTPDNQRQEHQVISSQSGNIDKKVIQHYHEFCNHPARFENSQKEGDLGKIGKIKREKNKKPS